MSYPIRTAFLGSVRTTLLVVVILVAGCGRGDRNAGAEMPGRAVYSGLNCPLCHGEYAEGSERAPALRDLGRNFSRQQLVQYLSDPDAYIAQDKRLSAQKASYSGGMPSFRHLGTERLGQLAEYLLTLQ